MRFLINKCIFFNTSNYFNQTSLVHFIVTDVYNLYLNSTTVKVKYFCRGFINYKIFNICRLSSGGVTEFS